MNVADFFAGLGGFSEGALQAGLRPAFAANHWQSAVEWHERNHPEARHACQDLQQLDMRLLPDLTEGVLLAGPACQGHSQNSQPARLGNRSPDKRRAVERGILQRSTAWAVIAAAEEARPRTILVENVPQFLDWQMLPPWIAALEVCGYHVRTHVLHADQFGSPQDRKRAIITADLRAPLDLVAPTAQRRVLADVLDLDDSPEHRWSDIDSKSDKMRTRMRKAQRQAGKRCVWNNVTIARGRPLDDLAPTLTTCCGTQLYLLDGDRGRVLNPRELARIQGFPDSYEIPTNRGLASKLIGNAIPVDLARGVCEQIAR